VKVTSSDKGEIAALAAAGDKEEGILKLGELSVVQAAAGDKEKGILKLLNCSFGGGRG
jgi:hypothetical protein